MVFIIKHGEKQNTAATSILLIGKDTEEKSSSP